MYNTRNPLGSSDARDLFDNARIIDEFLGAGVHRVADRFGHLRLTWNGVLNNARLDIAEAVEQATEEAGSYRDEAQEARDDAIAAASASGDFVFAKDLDDMQSKLPQPDKKVIEVAKDADHDNARTRYVVVDGVPVFVVNLDQLRADLRLFDGGNRVGYEAGTIQSALDRLLHSDMRQHQAAELMLGSEEEGGLLYAGAGNALQGLVILDTSDGPRMFVSQSVAGDAETEAERTRILCFAFEDGGRSIDPLEFTPELQIGHGQDLGGYVDDHGQVVLYTSAQPSPAVPAGKAVSRIIWRGDETTQADVQTFQLFGATATETRGEYVASAIGLSNDGKRVLCVASREIDNGRTLFTFDRVALEAAVVPLSVSPALSLVLQGETPSENATLQGVCADEYAVYLVFGFTAAFGRQNIAVYDWSGSLMRQIDMDTIRADNGLDWLLGNDEWGHPVGQETEGIAIYQGRLYTTLMDVWGHTNAITTYMGANWACINNTTPGIYPHVTRNWVLTNKPATHGAFDPAVAYTTAARTRRRKFLYCIQPEATAPENASPVTGAIPIGRPGAAANLRGNTVDLSYLYGQALLVGRWSESLRRYFPAMELTGSGYFNLYDTTIGADHSNWGGVRVVRTGGRQYTTFFGATGGGATGFSLNLYGAADSAYPGGSARLFNPANVAVIETDAGGQSTFTSRDNTKSPIIASRQAEGEVFVGRYGSSVRGALKASTAAFTIVARSGHGVVLATSAASDASADVERWRVAQDGVLHPVADAATNLGRVANRMNNSFFAVAPTITSDARLKQQFRALTAEEKAAAAEILQLPCAYKINDAVELKGDATARWHYGVRAQDVVAVLERNGVDWTMCGFIGHDEWPDEYVEHDATYRDSEVLGPDGEPLQILVAPAWREKIRDAGDRYSVRYQELDWFLKAAAL